MIDFYYKTQEFGVCFQRMNWVLSGDDGEETYFERLAEDLKEEIKRDNPDKDNEWIKKYEEYFD